MHTRDLPRVYVVVESVGGVHRRFSPLSFSSFYPNALNAARNQLSVALTGPVRLPRLSSAIPRLSFRQRDLGIPPPFEELRKITLSPTQTLKQDI